MPKSAEGSKMRMAELSRRSGMSVATIKYYLREGLLHPGRRTSVNQAVYDHDHLQRLGLIRALTAVAGLPLSTVRKVVEAVSTSVTDIDAMAVTQDALVGQTSADAADDRSQVDPKPVLDRIVAKRGWTCEPTSPAYRAAEQAIAQLEAEGLTEILERLDEYAEAADRVGRTDLAAIADAESMDQRIRAVVLGSVLRRPLFDALVLLAQQHWAQRES
jgi:DNA-binding transcriptional MerR regulator